jgi:hypothetical protein
MRLATHALSPACSLNVALGRLVPACLRAAVRLARGRLIVLMRVAPSRSCLRLAG